MRHMTIEKKKKWSVFNGIGKFLQPFSKHVCVCLTYNKYEKMRNKNENTNHDEINKYAKLLIY